MSDIQSLHIAIELPWRHALMLALLRRCYVLEKALTMSASHIDLIPISEREIHHFFSACFFLLFLIFSLQGGQIRLPLSAIVMFRLN